MVARGIVVTEEEIGLVLGDRLGVGEFVGWVCEGVGVGREREREREKVVEPS